MNPFTTKLNLPVKLHKIETDWCIIDTEGTQIAGNMGEETAFELAVILNTLPKLYTAARKELDMTNRVCYAAAQFMKELRTERDELKQELADMTETTLDDRRASEALEQLDTTGKSS